MAPGSRGRRRLFPRPWHRRNLWLAPATPGSSPFAKAVQALADDKAADALPLLEQSVGDPVIGGYARLYLARAQFSLDRRPDARRSIDRLLEAVSTGVLRQAALSTSADLALADGDAARAARDLGELTAAAPAPDVLLRLARAANQAKDTKAEVDAFTKIYYGYPLSPEADDAAKGLARLSPATLKATADGYPQELDRAARLFAAGRYADARKAYAALRSLSSGDDRALVDLRLAECELGERRYSTARAALLKLDGDDAARQVEVQFALLGTLRGLHRDDDYVDAVRQFVEQHPDSSYAEKALTDLGTFYIVANEDEKAGAVFAEQYQRYPDGPNAERAAWKAGWWAYKSQDYTNTARLFEDAATRMPHANTRPAWMYWAARAHEQLGERGQAADGYRAVIAAYSHTYYGRAAARMLDAAAAARRLPGAGRVRPVADVLPPALDPGDPPATARLITRLLEAGLSDDAIAEIQQARRTSGDTPLLLATLAFAEAQSGDLRSGITYMKRAYPQYLQAGGELLPVAIQKVIYPVAYWTVIKKYATAHELDPFLVAALINQESTFQADVRSSANAWGLMQIVPATGRRYARRLGIRGFTTRKLTDPVVNARIGTAYFADLMKQFGDLPVALASYNAGENRAERWIAERPGLDRDEFIDDIPFPETQGYVKRSSA